MQNEKSLRWAINLAALIVLMDLSVVTIALPGMRIHFSSTVSVISLVLMVSMLSASSSALIMGKISQLFSPKKLLIFGFVLFGLTSFLSGFVQEFNTLLVLRFVQGFAEAILYVIGPAVIKRYLAPEKQAQAYGQWMMSTGIGMSIGPLIGGFLVGMFSWSAVFFINIPFILLGLFFSLRLKFDKPIIEKGRFDFLGALWSFVFLASIIAALNLARGHSFSFFWPLALLFVSIIAFVSFFQREKKYSHPILQLSVFKMRNFWLASLGFFFFFTINVGSRFLRPFFFEEARGLSSELSGLLMFVAPSVMVLLSPLTGYFQKLLGTKRVVILGNFFLFLAMLMFSFWNQTSSVSFLIFSMFVLGLGMGFYYPATTTIGMLALPNSNYGMGSAAISTSKSLGKLFGVLVFAFLFNAFLEQINTNEMALITQERAEAFRDVFRFASVLAFVALIFSIFFKSEKKKG